MATLAKRIYPSASAIFIWRFEEATSRPYGYLVVDLKASTPERDRLHTDIFEANLATEEWQKSPESRKDRYPSVESDNEDDDRDSIETDITDNLVRKKRPLSFNGPLVNVEKRSL